MSYRIHIGIMGKKEYKKYLKGYKASKEEDKYFDIDTRIEISDDINLEQFKKIPIKQEEYHPCILKKKDFEKILLFYQDRQIEIAKDILNISANISKKYSNGFKDCEIETQKIINKCRHVAQQTLWYFEKLQKDNQIIWDSDYFKFQYFYLVFIYQRFNDKKHVLILTHG